MITTCRYCGSNNITTLGGEDGDPFNRCPAPMSVICCDCGKKLWDEEDSDGAIPKTSEQWEKALSKGTEREESKR